MPLSASDLGDRQTWPLRFVRPGKPTIHPSIDGITFTQELVYKQTWTDASTIDVDKYVEITQVGPNATTISLTLTATLTADYARNVVITVADVSAVVAMSGTITGKDRYGVAQTEAWSVTASGTSKTFTGKKAFSSISSITATAATDASANTIVAGDGKVLGLAFKCLTPSAIKEYEDTTLRTNGVIVVGSNTTGEDPRGTFTPNGTLNGALDWNVQYFVSDPTDHGA